MFRYGTSKIFRLPLHVLKLSNLSERISFYTSTTHQTLPLPQCNVLMLLLPFSQMDVLEFTGYGANTIKKFKISPDAFVQMALQLAVFKMTGTLRLCGATIMLQKLSQEFVVEGENFLHFPVHIPTCVG